MRLINPNEAILKLFASMPTITNLVGVQIAQQHKFAQEGSPNIWDKTQCALTVRPDPGGSSERDQPNWQGRVQLTCWGGTPAEAMRLFMEAAQVCDGVRKATVLTSTGTALIYFLALDGSQEAGMDADTKVDVVIQTARYRVFKHALEDLT